MRAVPVDPDPRLTAFVPGDVGWSSASQVSSAEAADALAWARATFQGAPLWMRVFLVAGWTALAMEGGPRSDDAHVLGWPIVHAAPQVAVLQRRSRLGVHATLLFATQADTVTFSSAMVHTTRAGRIVWAVVAPIHRWAVRVTLSHARPS